jgi:hypothetical protein
VVFFINEDNMLSLLRSSFNILGVLGIGKYHGDGRRGALATLVLLRLFRSTLFYNACGAGSLNNSLLNFSLKTDNKKTASVPMNALAASKPAAPSQVRHL